MFLRSCTFLFLVKMGKTIILTKNDTFSATLPVGSQFLEIRAHGDPSPFEIPDLPLRGYFLVRVTGIAGSRTYAWHRLAVVGCCKWEQSRRPRRLVRRVGRQRSWLCSRRCRRRRPRYRRSWSRPASACRRPGSTPRRDAAAVDDADTVDDEACNSECCRCTATPSDGCSSAAIRCKRKRRRLPSLLVWWRLPSYSVVWCLAYHTCTLHCLK